MKTFRIIILLLILVLVAFYSKLQRLESMAWVEPLPVSIYPINADGSQWVENYIDGLGQVDFIAVERFLNRQYKEHIDLDFTPISIRLEDAVSELPPSPPESGNVLSIVWWSLRMRYWAYQHSNNGDQVQVAIYVIYHQPTENKRLAHSLGLQKGLLGVVNAFAASEQNGQNNVVIAHELLHTVGASDKYDPATGEPIFPDGFVSSAEPRYPQTRAEIMAGRIPISATNSRMPDSLRQCQIGQITAREIGWID